jgi:hypothetical protein
VTRGSTVKVMIGVEVHGCFQLLDNRLVGFDEDKAIALALYPDAIGQISKCMYQGNIFENCNVVISETRVGLWKNSLTKDNQTINCTEKILK